MVISVVVDEEFIWAGHKHQDLDPNTNPNQHHYLSIHNSFVLGKIRFIPRATCALVTIFKMCLIAYA